MRVEFLIGPAGSGKTFRCLEGARAALQKSPEGLPLLFLAPKQATFQLERDLLSDPNLDGYTRLQFLPFDRLADYVLGEFFSSPPRLLSQEGRVMVLRAILAREHSRLTIFKSAARTAGFAQELSGILEELQRHKVTPAQLRTEAAKQHSRPQLAGKLSDFALLLESYGEWLNANELEDPNRLLDIAAEAINGAGQRQDFQIEALWLDGFAEMTPQEVHLLATIIPFCQRATLAFCLEEDAKFSSATNRSYTRCLKAVRAIPGCEPIVTQLGRQPPQNRFSDNPFLAHLEKHWTDPIAYNSTADSDTLDLFAPKLADTIQWFTCANPETEAVAAAHEILRFVRDRGGRYRDASVLVRSLQGYEQPLQRAFRRYGIPHFIDQRQPVAHHPLAELTRYALRTIAFDWRIEDWFGALKSGLVTMDDSALDRLELEAIAHGWQGAVWHHPLRIDNDLAKAEPYERLRKLLIPPFAALQNALDRRSTNGPGLCAAIRSFWEILDVERTLESWSRSGNSRDPQSQMHLTVWNQIDEWLDNLQIAFSHLELPLREWLPILEAGLCNLTIGVVPPSIDQVLIGSVDRSRNPDLKLVLVLGMNEGVFPVVSASNTLLSEADREHLQGTIALGANPSEQSAHERYLAYIACTRARERLVLTSCHFDSLGRAMNPSGLLAKFEALFPEFKPRDWQVDSDWRKAQHPNEIVPTLIDWRTRRSLAADDPLAQVAALPVFEPLRARLDHLPNFVPDECLSPDAAERLYGRQLRTAITRLEQFGQCHFRFFVTAGLCARERRTFELDRRKFGDFQHQVLRQFHEHLQKQNKRWRDITPQQARDLIREIAVEHAENYHEGLFMADEQDHFTARQLSLAMEEMIEVLVGWMQNYQFDPAAVELRFDDPGQIPAWKIPLEQGRSLVLTGSIDRVDVLKDDDEALCVVIDYKSSSRRPDRVLLHHGIQMQLPAYLSVLQNLHDPSAVFGVRKIRPAGFFYVSLRRTLMKAKNRHEAIAEAKDEAYRHFGRFNQDFLSHFDSRHGDAEEPAGQFNYRQNKDGTFYKRQPDPLPADEFEKLLADTEAQLQEFGNAVFRGETQINPYRYRETPCNYCDYRSICRIDPWTHKFRPLEAP